MATQPAVVEQNQPEVDQETGKFVYSYQPRDSEGQFIGKPYRFLYTDHQDLIKQITEAKENGDRFIHEVKTGKRQLKGEAATPRPTYEAAPESTEESERKEREAFRRVAEKEFGAPVETVRERLKREHDMEEYIIGNTWALQNEANGYYICPANAKKLYEWLNAQEPPLRFTSANLDLAFEAVKDALASKPKEQEPADSTQQQTPTQAAVKPQSTGMMPGQFRGTRQPLTQENRPLTVERFRQIDKMSRDQWKRLERDNPKEAQAFLGMRYPAQPQQ